MLKENSLETLLISKSLNLSDAWEISNGILDWLEAQHAIKQAPQPFYTALFRYHISEKKLIYPGESIQVLKSDLPPAYIAPEETGRIAQSPDYRADFYRLGIIWFELFSGRTPFYHDDRYRVIWQHLAESPPPLKVPGLPEIAVQIIEKLLSKRPDQRYFSIAGLRHDWAFAFHQFNHPSDKQEIFTPGTFDFPDTFSIPSEFNVRDAELAQAEAFANKVKQSSEKGFLWIEGQPYSGKTTFIDQCARYFSGNGFLLFRCACLQADIVPYQPIKTAFDHFAQGLLFSDSNNVFNIKVRLEDGLGENISVLTSFAPAWQEILGEQPSAGALDGLETQNRLSFVLAKTLAVIATAEHPIVFMLDDIHLIAQQTLRLLNAIFAEPDLKEILLVATANETKLDSKSAEVKKVMLNAGIFPIIENIQLGAIQADAIEKMLISARIDPAVAFEFAQLLQRKSGGISLFIKHLLDQVVQNTFIKPGLQKQWWQVDLKGFSTLSITENLQGFQQDKLRQLDTNTLEWLQVAACIGMDFDLQTVMVADEHVPDEAGSEIATHLQRLEIIVPNLFDNNFRFSNPALHTAVKDTIEPLKQVTIFEKIVASKIKDDTFLQSDNGLFKLLGYILQLSNDAIGNYHHLLKKGADSAKQIGAFDEAARYYQAILYSGKADNENEQFELNTQRLEMLIGDLQFDAYYRNVNELKHNFTIDEIRQCKLDLIECRALLIQQKMPEVVNFAQQSLQRMGISISLEPSLPRIIFSMIKSQRGMKGRSVAELEKLPLTNDPRTKYILQLLQDTSSAFFLAAPKALPEVLALQISMALKKGISETMGVVFAAYGFNLSAFGGQFAKAEEMMTLARNLDQRFGNVKGAIVVRFLHAALTRHWHFSLKENATLLRENYRLGRETGLLQMAFFSLATGDLFELYSGTPLSQMVAQMENDSKACADKQQHTMVEFLSMGLQFCADLRGKQKPKAFMEGDIFSALSGRKIFLDTNLQTNLAILNGLESNLYLIWRMNEGAALRLAGMMKLLSAVGLSSVSLLFGIIKTTVSAYKCGDGPNAVMRAARKKIAFWANQAPVNFKGWYHLLESVISRRKGNISYALFHIEQCIVWANRHEVIYLEALALEEKADIQMEWDKGEKLPMALVEAHRCYHRWGAIAKCAHLEAIHPKIRYLSLQSNASASEVDLTSLLRASNSIASEIRWEYLLEKLTTILVENAGAQTAIIITPHIGGLKEVARKTGQLPVSFEQVPVMPDTHPVSIFKSAKRLQKPELVNDPANDPRWAMDPYIVANKPLSVLCIPVVKNQDLSGIIYLENNLTAGAFTQDGLELLKLLSGQIAISIENAQLYVDLENRVSERTKQLNEKNIEVENQKNKLVETLNELQSTQKHLIQSEKMASLGELTAGIAHEIQNPLNFVTNFSDVSKELLIEMKEELEQENIGDALELADMVIANLEKVNFHGNRADAIVKGMLQHSRMSSGIKEPTDINELCDEYLRLAYHGLKAKNTSFHVSMQTDFDESIGMIELIPQDIGRVILNLISNAFYACEERRAQSEAEVNGISKDERAKFTYTNYIPEVKISTKQVFPPAEEMKVSLKPVFPPAGGLRGAGAWLEIRVMDNGSGIPDTVKDKIFQPFFTTKPTGEGTGLGLSLSYDIVKAHGGELKVETKEGEGSVFSIVLPV